MINLIAKLKFYPKKIASPSKSLKVVLVIMFLSTPASYIDCQIIATLLNTNVMVD